MPAIFGKYNGRYPRGPEALRVRIACEGFDADAVQSGEIELYPKAGGIPLVLDGVTVSRDPEGKFVWLTHVWAPTDLMQIQRGVYVVVAYVTLPNGVVRAEPRQLHVRDVIAEAP
jgi:hypothetical protein